MISLMDMLCWRPFNTRVTTGLKFETDVGPFVSAALLASEQCLHVTL